MLDVDELVFSPPELGCVLSLPGLSGGGSKIHDRGPYGNHGTITGAVWKKLPTGLWYLSFDGVDDYVDCGSGNSLDIAGSLSVKAWVKLTVTLASQPDNYPEVFGKQIFNYQNVNYWLAFAKTEDVMSFKGRKSDGSVYVFSLVTPSGISDKLGTSWHQLWGVWDRTHTTAYVYIDGLEYHKVTSQLDYDLYTTGDNRLAIGRGNGQADTFLKAAIALPRVYNYPWTALAIQNNFNREKHLFGVW